MTMKRIAALLCLLYGLAPTMAPPADQAFLSPALDSFARPVHTLPTLADLLTLEAQASIFYEYARDTNMSALFLQAAGTTLFVPTNKAVQALAQKPHENPVPVPTGVSHAVHEAISKSNVQRWVGAHIVARPSVNFAAVAPYDTLTPGATIAFHLVSTNTTAPPATEAGTDAGRLTAVRGRSATRCRARGADTDAAHRAAVKEPDSHVLVDTDAAHFTSVKRPASPGQSHTNAGAVQPESRPWKLYVINDGVHIISEKKASNGVMYLIDGTVSV